MSEKEGKFPSDITETYKPSSKEALTKRRIIREKYPPISNGPVSVAMDKYYEEDNKE